MNAARRFTINIPAYHAAFHHPLFDFPFSLIFLLTGIRNHPQIGIRISSGTENTAKNCQSSLAAISRIAQVMIAIISVMKLTFPEIVRFLHILPPVFYFCIYNMQKISGRKTPGALSSGVNFIAIFSHLCIDLSFYYN